MSREPSMEEILSSIRRVIARDESAMAAPDTAQPSAADAAPVAVQAGADTDDVLELTAISEADDAGDDGQAELQAAGEGPELVSPVSAAASRQSLDALAAALNGGQTDTAPTVAAPVGGDITVNQLVEAALRPLLKQWLDANLPTMVETMVAREISRITGNRF